MSNLFRAYELLNDLNVPQVTKVYPMDHDISENELKKFLQLVDEQFESATSII